MKYILEFQYSALSLFIDSGADLVLSILFVLALVLNSKKIYNCEANRIWVWYGVAQ